MTDELYSFPATWTVQAGAHELELSYPFGSSDSNFNLSILIYGLSNKVRQGVLVRKSGNNIDYSIFNPSNKSAVSAQVSVSSDISGIVVSPGRISSPLDRSLVYVVYVDGHLDNVFFVGHSKETFISDLELVTVPVLVNGGGVDLSTSYFDEFEVENVVGEHKIAFFGLLPSMSNLAGVSVVDNGQFGCLVNVVSSADEDRLVLGKNFEVSIASDYNSLPYQRRVSTLNSIYGNIMGIPFTDFMVSNLCGFSLSVPAINPPTEIAIGMFVTDFNEEGFAFIQVNPAEGSIYVQFEDNISYIMQMAISAVIRNGDMYDINIGIASDHIGFFAVSQISNKVDRIFFGGDYMQGVSEWANGLSLPITVNGLTVLYDDEPYFWVAGGEDESENNVPQLLFLSVLGDVDGAADSTDGEIIEGNLTGFSVIMEDYNGSILPLYSNPFIAKISER